MIVLVGVSSGGHSRVDSALNIPDEEWEDLRQKWELCENRVRATGRVVRQKSDRTDLAEFLIGDMSADADLSEAVNANLEALNERAELRKKIMSYPAVQFSTLFVEV